MALLPRTPSDRDNLTYFPFLTFSNRTSSSVILFSHLQDELKPYRTTNPQDNCMTAYKQNDALNVVSLSRCPQSVGLTPTSHPFYTPSLARGNTTPQFPETEFRSDRNPIRMHRCHISTHRQTDGLQAAPRVKEWRSKEHRPIALR
jgi:hypothetical protein